MNAVASALIPWLAVTAMAGAAAGSPVDVRPVPDDGAFERQCHDAVLALHQFFQQWFNGEVPENAESLAPFRDVLADDFQYVAPAGFLLDKSVLFDDGSWPGHGYWTQGGAAGGTTRVENFAFRRLSETTALVTFEYWQDVGDSQKGRQDTAIFRLDASKPHGVAWLHVQETWLPGTEK